MNANAPNPSQQSNANRNRGSRTRHNIVLLPAEVGEGHEHCSTVDPEGWRLTVSSDAQPPHTERGRQTEVTALQSGKCGAVLMPSVMRVKMWQSGQLRASLPFLVARGMHLSAHFLLSDDSYGANPAKPINHKLTRPRAGASSWHRSRSPDNVRRTLPDWTKSIILVAMDDELRLMLAKLAQFILALAEEQTKIRASIDVLKFAVMHLKGIPESALREFLDSLADSESRLISQSPNDQTAQQLRAIIARLESGHDPGKLDA